MRDCLNKKEKEAWLRQFEKRFHENYEKALSCGAIRKEDWTKHDYTLARCILIITAHQFEPLSDEGKEMLANLDKFI